MEREQVRSKLKELKDYLSPVNAMSRNKIGNNTTTRLHDASNDPMFNVPLDENNKDVGVGATTTTGGSPNDANSNSNHSSKHSAGHGSAADNSTHNQSSYRSETKGHRQADNHQGDYTSTNNMNTTTTTYGDDRTTNKCITPNTTGLPPDIVLRTPRRSHRGGHTNANDISGGSGTAVVSGSFSGSGVTKGGKGIKRRTLGRTPKTPVGSGMKLLDPSSTNDVVSGSFSGSYSRSPGRSMLWGGAGGSAGGSLVGGVVGRETRSNSDRYGLTHRIDRSNSELSRSIHHTSMSPSPKLLRRHHTAERLSPSKCT